MIAGMATHLEQNASPTGDRAFSHDDIVKYENALSMWLRWNEAHDQITSRMFDSREDPEGIEELLRQVDELRFRAIAAARALLDPAHGAVFGSKPSDMVREKRIG